MRSYLALAIILHTRPLPCVLSRNPFSHIPLARPLSTSFVCIIGNAPSARKKSCTWRIHMLCHPGSEYTPVSSKLSNELQLSNLWCSQPKFLVSIIPVYAQSLLMSLIANDSPYNQISKMHLLALAYAVMLVTAAPTVEHVSKTDSTLAPDFLVYTCPKKFTDKTCGGPPYLTKAKCENMCTCNDESGEVTCTSFKLCTGPQVASHCRSYDCICQNF